MSDQEKFKVFIATLPEELFQSMYEKLSSGSIDDAAWQKVKAYEEYSSTILSEFLNRPANKIYKTFNQKFNEVCDFIRTHFFHPEYRPQILELYPDLKNDLEKSVMRQRKLEELLKLLDELADLYEKFIRFAAKVLLNTDPGSTLNKKDYKSSFNDDESEIRVSDIIIPLPPYKNEHYLCRAMYRRKVKESVDWSLVYKEMENGAQPRDVKKDRRMIYDTVEHLNSRFIEQGLKTIFICKNNTVTRLY